MYLMCIAHFTLSTNGVIYQNLQEKVISTIVDHCALD